MSERLSLSEFLDSPDAEPRILATIQAVEDDEAVVEVILWSESLSQYRKCSQIIPRDNIEAVIPTEHRAGGRRVVEIVLAEGASVPTSDLLQKAHDCGCTDGGRRPPPPDLAQGLLARSSFLDRWRTYYFGSVDPDCFRLHQDYCLKTLGHRHANYCLESSLRACQTPGEYASYYD